MEQQERSKMLGTMPMGRLVPKVSVPIMVSMLVQALYNIVDGIFVARYSPNALTAVSLAFPIQLLMIAVATGLGVGINSLISRKLGQKRTEEAREAARCGMLLELCGFVVFLLFGLLGSHSFFHVFTPDPELQQMAGDYLRIVTVFSFGLFLSISFERMMQATGNTMLSMTTQLTGAVINIILDPIMIFGLLGFPQMGVAGAAGISERECLRCFERTIRLSPFQYLLKYRVMRGAETLLTDPASSVSEAASRCGFDSPSNFARIFKRFYHCTPREYRRANVRRDDALTLPPAPEA